MSKPVFLDADDTAFLEYLFGMWINTRRRCGIPSIEEARMALGCSPWIPRLRLVQALIAKGQVRT